MKKWLFVCFAMMLPFVVHAWDFCCPTDWCFKLSGGAEALYWRAYTDDFSYGQYSTGRLHEILSLKPEYDWGFRCFATVADKCGCNFLDFEWAKIRNSYDTITGPKAGAFLVQYAYVTNLLFITDLLRAQQTNHYQKFSAKLGHRFYGNNCRNIYGYLGGRWIHINVRQFAEGSGPGAIFVQQNSSFDGGGVETGIGGYTDLWCGFGTSIRLGAVGAMGNRAYTFDLSAQNVIPNNTSLFKKTSRCISGLDVRAEVNYTYRFECFWIRAEIGYEQNYYFNPLIFARPQGLAPVYYPSNFGMGGLIVGLTAGF